MKKIFMYIWQEIAKRGVFIIAGIVIAVFSLFTYFLVTGFSESQTTITIIIAAISAMFAAISSIAELFQTSEARRQRENQERPYIVADFVSTYKGALYFKILNAGNSPAKDVTLELNPDLIDYTGRKLSEVSFFRKPISFMPQGKEYSQIIGLAHKILAGGNSTKYQIRINYSSISGQIFDENIDFDLEYLKKCTLPSKTIEENLEDIYLQLKDQTEILRRQ